MKWIGLHRHYTVQVTCFTPSFMLSITSSNSNEPSWQSNSSWFRQQQMLLMDRYLSWTFSLLMLRRCYNSFCFLIKGAQGHLFKKGQGKNNLAHGILKNIVLKGLKSQSAHKAANLTNHPKIITRQTTGAPPHIHGSQQWSNSKSILTLIVP